MVQYTVRFDRDGRPTVEVPASTTGGAAAPITERTPHAPHAPHQNVTPAQPAETAQPA